MRISDRACAAGALLLLAACSDPASQTANTQVLARVEAAQRRAADDDGRILCAHGSDALARACTVEQTQDRRGLILTVRHDDDGRFHRLLVTRDGRGVVAADGAEAARVTIPDPQSIDVAIGDDRYRLPATVRAR
ncbi:MAG: hypothetical protein ACK4ZY_00780 [Sphingomonas sp.]